MPDKEAAMYGSEAGSVDIGCHLQCLLRQEAEDWIAVCPRLGIATQGGTEDQAKAALEEAVVLWFESCIERETLAQAMRETGFHRSQIFGESRLAEAETLAVGRDLDEAALMGTRFPLRVRIPAYQAAYVSG